MKKIVMMGLCLFSAQCFADTVTAVPVSSLASQFAVQAGTIAGAVQACGQSVVEYNSRVVEAVNALSKSQDERTQAMTAYEKALTQAAQNERTTHSLNCGEVMQSFNGLPLMRPDYKKTVLPQLAQMANPKPVGLSAGVLPVMPANAANNTVKPAENK